MLVNATIDIMLTNGKRIGWDSEELGMDTYYYFHVSPKELGMCGTVAEMINLLKQAVRGEYCEIDGEMIKVLDEGMDPETQNFMRKVQDIKKMSDIREIAFTANTGDPDDDYHDLTLSYHLKQKSYNYYCESDGDASLLMSFFSFDDLSEAVPK